MTGMSGLLFRAPGSWREAPGNAGVGMKKREVFPAQTQLLTLVMWSGAEVQR